MAKVFDTDFIMNFIQECAKDGLETTEDICLAANRKIYELDEKIKLRIKYMDVLKFLSQKNKKTEIKNDESISFDSIDKNLSDLVLKSIPISTENLLKSVEVKEENIICAVKSLIEKKVINRKNDILENGLNFDLFMNNVENK